MRIVIDFTGLQVTCAVCRWCSRKNWDVDSQRFGLRSASCLAGVVALLHIM